MRTLLAALSCVVIASSGCGGTVSAGDTPESVARAYERAIVAKDGNGLCETFTPKLREVLVEQIREQAAGDTQDGSGISCGAIYRVVLNGYPHENIDREFTAAKLLDVGAARRVRRSGTVYVKVPATVSVRFVYTGYSIRGGPSGKKGAAAVRDTVWLAKGAGGRWGVVKPSLVLYAANTPDVLSERWQVAKANAAPPDADYSMNRAERTASEAADYRRSFRRDVAHAPLHCAGQTTMVGDPARDAITYPTGSALHRVRARDANDVVRATVTAARKQLCVTLIFRTKPAGHLRLGFVPRSRRAAFGEYVVELDPRSGVRAGGLTSGYRYFRGGERLRTPAVGTIALYGNTISFIARMRAVPNDVAWSATASAASGTDRVPNAASGVYRLVGQRNGRIVTP
ncbi:MAG: hypothetical protein ACJ747_08300 [Gaiellaceae bacterium]